jgi:HD domain
MSTTVDSPRLPSQVAGIRLVDSDIARKATQLAKESSAPYLFNHAMRTFLFASLIGRAVKQNFDEELVFLACTLHDLGLTDRFQGDAPFEIEGAEAARRFLEANSYPKQAIETVWDGIAMHASPIAQYKKPETALVAEGAGADVLGADPTQISKSYVDQIMNAFPRLRFKSAFVTNCADVVRKHPRGASRGFMRDIGQRHVPGFSPKNFCDLLDQAPYAE